MSEKITRREAIIRMAAAGTGIAVAGSVLESCAGKKTSAPAAPKELAPEGSSVATRTWDTLGDTLSLLGLGCMRFPTVKTDGQGGGHNAPLDQEKINEMVDYSLAHGINYFDTAPAYGESEKATGIALSRHPRESYRLATKMSNFAFGPNAKATLEGAQKMFETSLQNLQTDYIDFFLCHSINSMDDFRNRFVDNGVLDWIFEQKAAGKIKHVGFSYHGDNETLPKVLDSGYKWEFVQIQLNYVDWKDMPDGGPRGGSKTDAETLYNELVKRNIPVVVMEPVKGGSLANVSDALKAKLATRHPELSPAGAALTFVASKPGVAVTLSGMSNMEQLQENVATFTDFKEFDDADNAFMQEVAELYKSNTHVPCTGCSYCMPCPNGVNIPGNFKVFNTTSDELNIPDPTKQDKDYKKKKKIFLTRYNKDLADGSRADACTKCNVCLQKCPQHIRIPDQLQKINDLVKSLG